MQRGFDRRGLGYVLSVPDIAVDLTVSQPHRRGGDVVGEVVVSCGLEGTRSRDGVLHMGKLNLSSTTSRATLARYLTERTAQAGPIDWQDLLEDFCSRVLRAERNGRAVVRVGDRPARIAPRFQLSPIVPWRKTTTFFGSGGTGKSTLAVAAAVSVQTGITVVPGWNPTPTNVLYLDWETDEDDIDEKVKAIAKGAGIEGEVTISYLACHGRSFADQLEGIAEAVQETQAGFVVVDSVVHASGTSSSEGADAAETTIRLYSSFAMLEATVLAIDHVDKASSMDPNRPAKPYGCYSADTEVLTRHGWIRHADLVGEAVLAFDPVTERLAWEHPTAFHRHPFEGELIRWSTRATHSLVTANHRMVVKPDWPSGRGQTWRFVQAGSVPTSDLRLVAAGTPPTDGADVSEPWVRLLGWWVAEGSVQNRRLRLSQNAGPLAKRIEDTLTELGLKVWRQERARPGRTASHVTWVINGAQELADRWASECGTSSHTKHLPWWVFDMAVDRRIVLLEALIDGDGHRLPSGGQSYHTSSPQLADDVQRLAILCGLHADVARDTPSYKGEPRPTYRVNISPPGRTTTAFRPDRAASREPYQGDVYCLTVPSGAYVTRLQGRMAIQGNSIFKENMARQAFEVRRQDGVGTKSSLALYNTKANLTKRMGTIGLSIDQSESGDLIRYEREEVTGDLLKPLSLPVQIDAMLAAGALHIKELAELLETDEGKVRATLSRGKKTHRYVSLGEGRWGLASNAG